MTTRSDTFISDYATLVPVTNGVAWYGPIFPLYNAAGLTAYINLSGGAAGNVLASPTNAVGIPSLYIINNNTYPAQLNTLNVTIAANSANSITFLPSSNGIYANAMYLSFTPTASGFLTISINIRRYGC